MDFRHFECFVMGNVTITIGLEGTSYRQRVYVCRRTCVAIPKRNLKTYLSYNCVLANFLRSMKDNINSESRGTAVVAFYNVARKLILIWTVVMVVQRRAMLIKKWSQWATHERKNELEESSTLFYYFPRNARYLLV